MAHPLHLTITVDVLASEAELTAATEAARVATGRADELAEQVERLRTVEVTDGRSLRIPDDSADVAFVPSLKVEIDADTARRVFKLIDALEDLDDVQNVYANYDVPPEVLAELDED